MGFFETATLSSTHIESENTSMPTEAYDAAHYLRVFPAGYAAHFWHRARLRVVLAALAKIDAAAVLDVGCGPGQYVKALREAGYDAFGCDPGEVTVNADLAACVFPRTDIGAIDPSILARVEVVLLLDVVEHLADPAALLARVRRMVPRLKAVIVTVPARPELWSDLDRRAGHHRRFRLDDLSALLVDSGFIVTEMTYLFRLLYPAAWLAARSTRSRVISSPAYPRIHRMVGQVLAAEGAFLPKRLPGTSALCIAQPRREENGSRA